MPCIYRRKSLLIFGLFLALVWAFGQAKSQESEGIFWVRCNAWSEVFNKTDKTLYLGGLLDGLIFSRMKIQGVELPSMPLSETVQGVDWLCSDPANLNIPVPFILKVAGMRTLGMSQQAIDDELREKRALMHALTNEP